ncbi:MAG: hypothetical protein ACW99G_04965 [Candidatus Thorarchaeota archaeon]|jgi:hypothetical protein
MTEMFHEYFLDLLRSEQIIGMTILSKYESGPNREHPVTMQFTGFEDEGDYRRIKYILHNPNTEKYALPREFSFDKKEFIQEVERREEAVSYFITDRPVGGEPQWEV